MASVLVSPKQMVRDEVRTRLRRVTCQQRAEWSASAGEKMLALPEVAAAREIFIFASMPSEMDTDGIVSSLLAAGKKVAMPHMVQDSNRLQAFYIAGLADLRMNGHGVREPAATLDSKANPSFFDLIVVPGMAFDRAGHRLGRGMGYYDRYFSEEAPKAFRVGLFYSVQEFDDVPVNERDRSIHCVVTEKEVIRAGAP